VALKLLHTADWHLVRKSGDAVYYIAKQFELMPRLGIPVKSEWKKGLRRVCDAFVRLWEHAGQFGQFVDSRTGKVVVGGSSSGAIVPAGLAVASRWFGKERYLETACAAADAFYRDFVKQGVSCGGPGDACQNPDSESWYALVESFTELYEVTGNPQWLERATQAARQFATWVVSYDFKFPAPSTFAQAGIRSTGAVFANTQNKHAAPGMCTYSGLALLKLYRATGDRFYLDLLFDVAHNMPQYLPHPCHPLGSAVPGHMCERVNLTDWEGPERIGETLKMSTWAETSLMLTAIEIPGVYVRPDRVLAVAFDNVTAEILPSSRSLEVRLANPTPVAAEVRVFAETEAEAEKPLPDNYLFACCKITLEPGGMRSLVYAK
jgi:rhamnogalacturonyl hydrolase YesR